MILTKYAPISAGNIVGNQAAIREITGWLVRGKGALLVHGPVGTGKTSAIRLVAKEHGYEVLEVHSDEKTPISEITAASNQRSIFGKKKLILIENISSTRGLSDILKGSCPIICTALDAYKLSPSIRKMFKVVKFEKPSEAEMILFAKKIAENEGMTIDQKKIQQLVRIANGDIRAMLIDMDAVRLGTDVKDLGYRNFEENIFNTIKLIFKTMSMDNARIAVENSEKDVDELFLWLENNIVDEYTDIESIASAYDYLSKADVFSSRIIRRQAWSLQKYASDLTIYGTALSKKRPSARFVAYRPPFFRRVSRSALVKIAVGLHTSTAHAREYIPIIKTHPNVCEELGLDENETESLLSP